MHIVHPSTVGLSARRLQRLHDVMQRHVDHGHIAGAVVLVARHGRVAHLDSVGYMDVARRTAMRREAIFRIYSMTKPITSVAALMLYEEGHFHLNDPIRRFIPEFGNVKVFAGMRGDAPQLVERRSDITFMHLLTHTSGLSYGRLDDTPVDEMYRRAGLMTLGKVHILNPDLTLAELVRRLVALPLWNQPGAAWRYSISTDVLARLVEVISGMAFGDFLQQRLFGPLGMVDTAYHVPPDKVGRFTTLYGMAADGRLEVFDPSGEGSPYLRALRLQSGGSGLVSTAADYLRFVQMLLNGGMLDGVRILSRKTVELMTRPHVTPQQLGDVPVLRGWGLGLGLNILTDLTALEGIGSEGTFSAGGAAKTLCWADPKEQLVALLMVQHFGPSDIRLHDDFRVLVYQAVDD